MSPLIPANAENSPGLFPKIPIFTLSWPDEKSIILSAFDNVAFESPAVNIKLSFPVPPVRVSDPWFPVKLSLPVPPSKESFELLPIKSSSPDNPFIVDEIVEGAVRVSLDEFWPLIVSVSCPEVKLVAVILDILIVLPALALITKFDVPEEVSFNFIFRLI